MISRQFGLGVWGITMWVVASSVYAQPSNEVVIAQLANQMRRLETQLSTAEATRLNVISNVLRISKAVDGVDQEVKVIRKTVDKPLLSELWFGFISDRFTTFLNRVLGLESGPSTPLWAAGFLSAILLFLKIVSLMANKLKPDTTLGKVLGRVFAGGVFLYLAILTASFFMLASHAPNSSVGNYADQLKASDTLIAKMDSLSDQMTTLRARLEKLASTPSPTQTIVQLHQSVSPTDLEAIKNAQRTSTESLTTLVAVVAKDVNGLDMRLHAIDSRQHGRIWTWMVGLAAFIVLCVAGRFFFEWVKERWN